MEKVFSLVNGFLGGLGSLFMAFIPVTILWYVLTGGTVFGMDAIANLTSLVNTAAKFDQIRQSFKGAYNDMKDEQKSSVRGGQGLAYDQL